jgi:hypothetical protein
MRFVKFQHYWQAYKPRIVTRKEIEEGERLPKYYGLAWHEFDRDVGVCFVYPFNILLGYLRTWYLKARYFRSPVYRVMSIQQVKAKYDEGFIEGCRLTERRWVDRCKECKGAI